MLPLPFPLALLLLPLLTTASPSPALVSDAYIPLIPRNFLFLRQLSDLQTFASALGGVPASPITDSGDPKRPFSVDGDTFTDFESAAQRSCDNQFNKCGQAANGGGNKGGLTVGECDKQKGRCISILYILSASSSSFFF